MYRPAFICLSLLFPLSAVRAQAPSGARPRARDIGVVVGILPTGPLNALTDVPGVLVGQVTVSEGDSVRTGVTAIRPHGGNMFFDRVPAAIYVGNGFGKLVGATQVHELGEIETPILLTCTLCVWKAADAMVDWMTSQPNMASVASINPVVGETNDGSLNAIRERPIRPEQVVRALESARGGPIEEGAVGAGTGTIAFGYKGGIGTSSRRLPTTLGGYTVGVLVQTNFGGVLTINGAPVGRELGSFPYRKEIESDRRTAAAERALQESETGSCMIVVATDAPLDARNLERIAKRAIVGLGRTGSDMHNGSGDYVIAFSTATSVRRVAHVRGVPAQAARDTSSTAASTPADNATRNLNNVDNVDNDNVSPLFLAVAEATEEAIYNSLFRATTTKGNHGLTVHALPLDSTVKVLRKYNALHWDQTLPPVHQDHSS